MLKLFLFSLCGIFINIASVISQPWVKNWDARYGCSQSTFAKSITLSDHSMLLMGSTIADSCSEISQQNYDSTLTNNDFWIILIDSLGNKIWDHRYGSTGDEVLNTGIRTDDNGYLLGGTTNSYVGNDVSELSRGNLDYWIIKIDSLGNKLWDKRYGGDNVDVLMDIIKVNNAFYLVGNSLSDSGFDKSDNNFDSTLSTGDYWILKIDAQGNIIWDKTLGGSREDIAVSGIADDSISLMICGYSWSTISGSKTSQNKDTTLISSDFWILKIDSAGNILRDASFGGTDFEEASYLIALNDSTFIAGGMSTSNIGFDVTDSSRGSSDYWIVKFDRNFNILWTHRYGGSSQDDLRHIDQNGDRLLLSGESYSPASFEKTENNYLPGISQGWLLEVDNNGTVIWNKTILNPGYCQRGNACYKNSGCIIFSNSTTGGIGGYKSQNNRGNGFNYWILELCDSSFIANVPEEFQTSNIILYPNPTTHEFYMQMQDERGNCNNITLISNLQETKLSFAYEDNSRIKVLIPPVTSGMYYLRINFLDYSVYKKVIIIN